MYRTVQCESHYASTASVLFTEAPHFFLQMSNLSVRLDTLDDTLERVLTDWLGIWEFPLIETECPDFKERWQCIMELWKQVDVGDKISTESTTIAKLVEDSFAETFGSFLNSSSLTFEEHELLAREWRKKEFEEEQKKKDPTEKLKEIPSKEELTQLMIEPGKTREKEMQEWDKKQNEATASRRKNLRLIVMHIVDDILPLLKKRLMRFLNCDTEGPRTAQSRRGILLYSKLAWKKFFAPYTKHLIENAIDSNTLELVNEVVASVDHLAAKIKKEQLDELPKDCSSVEDITDYDITGLDVTDEFLQLLEERKREGAEMRNEELRNEELKKREMTVNKAFENPVSFRQSPSHFTTSAKEFLFRRLVLRMDEIGPIDDSKRADISQIVTYLRQDPVCPLIKQLQIEKAIEKSTRLFGISDEITNGLRELRKKALNLMENKQHNKKVKENKRQKRKDPRRGRPKAEPQKTHLDPQYELHQDR